MLRVHHVVLAAILFIVTARPSGAGILAWLEELSGPGPFDPHGAVAIDFVPCTRPSPGDSSARSFLGCDPTKRLEKYYVSFGWTQFRANPDPARDYGSAKLDRFDLMIFARYRSEALSIPIDVGSGVARYELRLDPSAPSAQEGRLDRWAIPVRIRAYPGHLFLRKNSRTWEHVAASMLVWEGGVDVIPGPISRESLGVGPADFRERHEVLLTHRFYLNAGPVALPAGRAAGRKLKALIARK